MKFGITQLWAKTPTIILQVIQFMAALGAALVAFFAKADYPAELENIILKIYADVMALIAIAGQFFGVETTETYPVKK
ncbi:hypothetical protein [Runella zeae]|uniref:hypothetical protein n=1 Tax=Runella zeae TaxID=94255 RepID=UPI002356A865|nr:hypothetical protein [Runella zeae]